MDDSQMEDMKKLEELILAEDDPSPKRIMDIIQEAEISDEMKENLKSMLSFSSPQVLGGSSGYGTLLAVVFVVLIFSVILFIGYKLYKSIKDKELKKEEKKKAKQMKKKK